MFLVFCILYFERDSNLVNKEDMDVFWKKVNKDAHEEPAGKAAESDAQEPVGAEELKSMLDALMAEHELLKQQRKDYVELARRVEELECRLREAGGREESAADGGPQPEPAPEEPQVAPVAWSLSEGMWTDLASKVAEMHGLLESGCGKWADENRLLAGQADRLEQLLEEKQQRLEEVLQAVQEDRSRKDKIKLVNRCIRLSDLVRKTLDDFAEEHREESLSEKEEFLQKQLQAVVTGLEEALKAEGIQVVQTGVDGGDFDAELHKSVDVQATDKPEWNGKVCRSISPAFIWTLPYILRARKADEDRVVSYRFLLREEQVVTYRYQA